MDLIRRWVKEHSTSRAHALELRLRGLSYEEVGKQMGFSRQRAQQLLRPPIAIYNSVRQRAQSKCENCGVEIRAGHVHHRKCVGATPDDYHDIENLQYLCVGCHQKAHGGWSQMWNTTTAKVRKQWKRESRVPLSKEGLAQAGHKGGSSTSEAKRRAAKVNLAKARRKRWAKLPTT